MSDPSHPYAPPRMSPPSEGERRGGLKPSLTWAQSAARASWMSTVLSFVIMAMAGRHSPLLAGLLVMLFTLFGFGAGVAALIGRHGQEKVLAPALVGLALNGGL